MNDNAYPDEPGIWLDQNYTPPLKKCTVCGDPLSWGEVMIKWVDDEPITPLCSVCFDFVGVTS